MEQRRRVFTHGWPCDSHMRVLCMHTARVTVSVQIRVSVRKLRFITRLAICSYYTVMHTVHDNRPLLCISAEMTSNKAQ